MNPTVCISVTPPDEAAALRVAAALGETGVEVVLTSEAGTEAVESCDLFLPIVSSNTQSEASGRFRNEWQRAALRAQAMNDDTSFLLPVVVDDTANREAKVPEVFRGRAWLRFDVWGSSTPLASRVEAMLERRATARALAAAAQRAEAEAEAKSWVRRWVKRLPPWVRRLRIVWVLSLIILPGGAIAWRLTNAPPHPEVERRDRGVPIPTVRVAAAPDPTPRGVTPAEPRHGKAPAAQPETASRSIRNVEVYPNDKHESVSVGGVSEPLPAGDERALDPLKQWRAQPEMPRSQGVPVRDSTTGMLPLREIWAALSIVPGVGPEESSRAMVAAMPESRTGGNPATDEALTKVLIDLWQGNAAKAEENLARMEGEWIDCAAFVGPRDLLVGVCLDAQRERLGVVASNRLAREAWLRAWTVIRARRIDRPEEVELTLIESQVLALLGRETGALEALRVYDDSPVGRAAGPQREHLIVWATLGDYTALMDEIVTRFRDGKQRWAEVRNWLRYDPRFAVWRQQMAARDEARLN